MITYLKNQSNYKADSFKGSLENIKNKKRNAKKSLNRLKRKFIRRLELDKEETTDYDKEKEELRIWLSVVPDEEAVVNLEILHTRYPIVDWESQTLGDMHVYKIIRADGNTSYHKTFESMGDLKTLFDPDEVDEVWRNQQEWRLLKWKLHEFSEIHTLSLWGVPMELYMFVEKKYPLTKDILKKMLKLQLEAEEESTIALELIKFIKSQIEE
ncbi:hypothetical protein Tco_1361797 [Tanacetum coccineum]